MRARASSATNATITARDIIERSERTSSCSESNASSAKSTTRGHARRSIPRATHAPVRMESAGKTACIPATTRSGTLGAPSAPTHASSWNSGPIG